MIREITVEVIKKHFASSSLEFRGIEARDTVVVTEHKTFSCEMLMDMSLQIGLTSFVLSNSDQGSFLVHKSSVEYSIGSISTLFGRLYVCAENNEALLIDACDPTIGIQKIFEQAISEQHIHPFLSTLYHISEKPTVSIAKKTSHRRFYINDKRAVTRDKTDSLQEYMYSFDSDITLTLPVQTTFENACQILYDYSNMYNIIISKDKTEAGDSISRDVMLSNKELK